MTSLIENPTISHRETARRMAIFWGGALESIKPRDGTRNSVPEDRPSGPVVPVWQEVAIGAPQKRILDVEAEDQVVPADAPNAMARMLQGKLAATYDNERPPSLGAPDGENVDQIGVTLAKKLAQRDVELCGIPGLQR